MSSRPSAADDLSLALQRADGVGTLPQEVLRALAAEMSIVSLDDGESLILQNERGATFCVVLSGTLAVTWQDRKGIERRLPDLPPGAIAGEVSLLGDSPALVSVYARSRVRLAQLTREGYERLSERCPAGALALIDALRRHLHQHAFRFTLHHSKYFRDFDTDLLIDLEAELEPVSLYGGETLLRQGDDGDCIYIVISGRLRVVERSNDRATVLAELGPGETIGEMAVITGEPRSADVVAIRDTHLARLPKTAVERLLVRHPMSALALLGRGLVSRLRSRSEGRSHVAPLATIAIVPAHPDAPLDEFAMRLRESLSRLGSTQVVTSTLVDIQLGRSGAAQAYDRHGAAARLVEWLAEQELEHRYVVYQADPRCTPWTERSIRQADHIVIVADAGGDPRLGEIETELLNREGSGRISCTLALCYSRAGVPSGTARWFTGRVLARHVHVRMAESGDFDRVARLLTGQAIALVLGGGFARGMAHVGVLRALREHNVPIDVLGGSSMGAMIGAQHLLGWDADRIVNEITIGLASSLDDITLPFLSFKRGGKYARLLHSFFGDARIEDLWLPFFCTSSNLNRADLKVYTTGSLATALLATTRAPAVFPPLVIDGELHVDGGLINNVPVDVMKPFANHGKVIGVDVSPPHQVHPVIDYGDDVSGWQAMWSRFNPTRTKRSYRPSILIVLMRLIEFGGISYRMRNAAVADLYISPDVLRFKRNDFHKAAEIVEAGYKRAYEDLGIWLRRCDIEHEGGRRQRQWIAGSDVTTEL